MCGIVGVASQRNVSELLVKGLYNLEYRGYDSAGVSIINAKGISTVKSVGKVADLEKLIIPKGNTGIGHTRWATHGQRSVKNAHPHNSCREVSIVHNGIIENYDTLRKELKHSGFNFVSETDTEVIAHLICKCVKHYTGDVDGFRAGVIDAISQLKGSYALAIVHWLCPDTIIVARSGSPLVIGLGEGENYIASDIQALGFLTNRFIFLEEHQHAVITKDDVKIYNNFSEIITPSIVEIEDVNSSNSKGGYSHFMQKEIFEQPEVFERVLEGRITEKTVLDGILGSDFNTAWVDGVQIVACGTSYFAGLVAQYWFEEIAHLPCRVDIASEFRYRKPATHKGTLLITISQSGETADTIAALAEAKKDIENYVSMLTITNSMNSTLVRESDYCMAMNAGPEIGVAATKSFTNALGCLLLVVVSLGKQRFESDEEEQYINALRNVPYIMKNVLLLSSEIKEIARCFHRKNHALFLGRGPLYPIALEGALKMKEISYIHAEGYAGGELKHGPLALVDNHMPVVALAPNNILLDKLNSNLEVVSARGGNLYVIGEGEEHMLRMPPCGHQVIEPMIYTIVVQLLAYHVAIMNGTDIDQPRNLAKSVTVE